MILVNHKSKHETGWRQLISLAAAAAAGTVESDGLLERLKSIGEGAFIGEHRMRAALIESSPFLVEILHGSFKQLCSSMH